MPRGAFDGVHYAPARRQGTVLTRSRIVFGTNDGGSTSVDFDHDKV